MRVSVNDPMWTRLYYRIRGDMDSLGRGYDRRDIELYLSSLNIAVVKDEEGSWSEIALPTGPELTVLMLRYT